MSGALGNDYNKTPSHSLNDDSGFCNLLIMSHKSNFTKIWKLGVNILSLISMYVYSYAWIFGPSEIIVHIKVSKSKAGLSINLELIIEFFFFLNLIKNFLTDYVPVNQRLPVKNFQQIVTNYLNNGFLIDLICTIPICFFIPVESDNEFYPFLYMIKFTRIKYAIQILDEKQWISFLTNRIRERNNQKILTDHEFAND